MPAGSWEERPERFALAPIYHDVAEVIGWDRAIRFGWRVWWEKRPPSGIHDRARGLIYIPKKLRKRCGSELIRIAGEHDAALLVNAFGGMPLEFPNILPASISRRNRAIVQQIQEGIRPSFVAASFGLSLRQVRRIASMESSACPAAKR